MGRSEPGGDGHLSDASLEKPLLRIRHQGAKVSGYRRGAVRFAVYADHPRFRFCVDRPILGDDLVGKIEAASSEATSSEADSYTFHQAKRALKVAARSGNEEERPRLETLRVELLQKLYPGGLDDREIGGVIDMAVGVEISKPDFHGEVEVLLIACHCFWKHTGTA